MDCLSCGADIGPAIGLCAECRTARARTRPTLPAVNHDGGSNRPFSSAFNFLQLNPTLAAVFLLGPIVLYLLFTTGGDDDFRVDRTGQGMALSSTDGKYKFVYSPQGSATETVRVINYDVMPISMKSGAIGAHLAYLSEEEYGEFQAVQGCKASFLNSHVKHVLFIPTSKSNRDTQKKFRANTGDRIVVKMSDLTTASIQINGRTFGTDGWLPGSRLSALVNISKVRG